MKNYCDASLYVGTYGKYAAGSIAGEWVRLDDFVSAKDFLEYCKELHKDEKEPEFMFQDFEDMPEALYHESMTEDDIQRIYDWMEYDEDDRNAIAEYLDEINSDADFDAIVDSIRYSGDWESFADMMADEMLDSCNCPDCLRNYFDYEAWRRDLRDDCTITSNYVFAA